MGESEKYGRPDYGNDDGAARPILNNALDETTIDQLFAERHRSDQSEKRESFDVVLGEQLQCQLRKNSLNFFRLCDEATQTHNLIEQNQRGQDDRGSDCQRWIGNGQAELAGANFVSAGAPQNHARGDPLKCESRSVE